MADSLKLIVKVGKHSNLIFSHSKVSRALTVDEMRYLANSNSGYDIIIVEHIFEEEATEAENFIRDFLEKDIARRVYFIVQDNDELTLKTASNLSIPVIQNLPELHTEIFRQTGTNVSNLLSERAASDKQTLDESSADTDVQDKFDELGEDSSYLNVDGIDDMSTDIQGDLSDLADGAGDNPEYKEKLQKAVLKFKEAEKANLALREQMNEMTSRFEEFMARSPVIEDPISLSGYQELKNKNVQLEEKLKQAETKVNSLTSKLSSAEKRQSEDDARNVERDLEIKKHKHEIEKLVNDYEQQLKEQKESLTFDLKQAEARYESASQQVNSLVEQLNDLYNEQTTYATQQSDSKDRIHELEANIRELQESLEKVSSDNTVLMEKLEEEARARLVYSELISEAIRFISSREEQVVTFERSAKDSKARLEEVLKENESNIETIKRQLIEIQKYKDACENIESQIAVAVKQEQTKNQRLEQTLKNLENQLAAVKGMLDNKTKQYNDIVRTVGFDPSGIKALKDENDTLRQANMKLESELREKTDKYDQKVSETSGYTERIKELTHNNEQLKRNVTTLMMSRGNSGGGSIAPINYQGKAKIIPVFGYGSYGTTTVAVTLASKLAVNGKVAFLDMDLSSPSADAFFKKQPLIKSLPSVPDFAKIRSAYMKTALGVLYELGFNAFYQGFQHLRIPAEASKNGGVDYFAGCLHRPESYKVLSVDYDKLFKLLSSQYNYIVIDLGKLGASETTQKLAKALTSITNSSVAVTLRDGFSIRNFRLQIDEAGIDRSRVAWLLNMSDGTAIDEKWKASLGERYGIIPYIDEFYGTREKFMKNKQARDKFNVFIEEKLLV